MKQNKKAMAMQAVFYIFMSIVMIALIVFGFKQIFLVSDQLGESERVKVQNQLIEKFESCEDPLNKGNVEYIKLKNQKFNSICFLGNDYETSSDLQNALNNYDEIKAIGSTNDNVVLLYTKLAGSTVTSNDVISTLSIDIDLQTSFCYFPTENTDDFNFKLECN